MFLPKFVKFDSREIVEVGFFAKKKKKKKKTKKKLILIIQIFLQPA